MPISAVRWRANPGRDFDTSRDRHLLRTESFAGLLDDVMFAIEGAASEFDDQSAGEYLAVPGTDVEIEFSPLFRCQRLANVYSGFGIRVDATTGSISFDAGPRPANAPRNFIVQVSVRANRGGKLRPEEIPVLLLRFHVHESVTQIWLSPSSMTIRVTTPGIADDTLHRFTAYAEFDDDTIGDVTDLHGITWTTPGQDSPRIDDDGFITFHSVDVPGTTVQIVATTSAAWGSKPSLPGDAIAATPWAANPPIVATLVEGPPAAWMTMPMQADLAANVLFLGIGFLDEDDYRFESLVAGVVNRMKRDRITRPYDLVSDSMNFWRARVPTGVRGITIRSEVVVFDDAPTLALPVSAAESPRNTPWSLAQLSFAVGRALPADLTREVVALRDEFVKRALPEWALAISDETIVKSDVIREWRYQGRRRFVEALDGFPPLVVGSPPSVQNDSGIPFMHCPVGYRGTADRRSAFFRTFVADNGATVSGGKPIGTLWGAAPQEFAFDNRSLVVLLGATRLGRSVFDEHVLMSMEPQKSLVDVQPVLGAKALRLKVAADDLPFDDARALWRVAAHELAHTFGLGDEYPVTRARLVSDAAEKIFDKVPNVLSMSSVLKALDPAAPPSPAGSRILGDLIKWRWPRMQKVAVIAGPGTLSGNSMVFPVGPRHALQFKKDMRVHIRARSRGEPLKRLTIGTDVTAEFDVGDITSENSLTLIGLPGGMPASMLGAFDAGALIFAPVPPPGTPPPADYPYAELLTYGVRKWLTEQGTSDPVYTCDVDLEYTFATRTQVPTFDRYPFTFSPRNNARLIGLYNAGGGYACGTYHPAGLCMMRNVAGETDEFCAVCRYVLVDAIDPTVHPDIEKDLAGRNFE